MLKSNLLSGHRRAAGGRIWSTAIMLLLLCVPAARAQDHFLAQQSNDGPAASQAAAISQRQALELVRARFPGTVISINEIQQRGELVYRVRLDNDGNIFTVYVNAVTGAITREQ
ncbi:MAG: PepSY domain-containing protein [Pseudohongiellaceae bacterium]